jgi:CspA family cold shock protein
VVPLGAGVGQPAAADEADGTASWYDKGKGFGFISRDRGGQDVFVQVRALADGLTWLTEGDRVPDRPVTAPERSYSSRCPTAYWGLLTR